LTEGGVRRMVVDTEREMIFGKNLMKYALLALASARRLIGYGDAGRFRRTSARDVKPTG
jgi:hypothetical protein